eukprot:202196-Pyramimonas_sp.AAC.1
MGFINLAKNAKLADVVNKDVYKIHRIIDKETVGVYREQRREFIEQWKQTAAETARLKPYYDWMSLKVTLPKLIIDESNGNLDTLEHLRDYIIVRLMTSYPLRDDLGKLFIHYEENLEAAHLADSKNKANNTNWKHERNKYVKITGEIEISDYKTSLTYANQPIKFTVDHDLKAKIEKYLQLFTNKKENPENPK